MWLGANWPAKVAYKLCLKFVSVSYGFVVGLLSVYCSKLLRKFPKTVCAINDISSYDISSYFILLYGNSNLVHYLFKTQPFFGF